MKNRDCLSVNLLFKTHAGLILSVCVLAVLGTAYQYSTSGESWIGRPLAHALRFCGLFLLMIVIANSSIKFWHAWAYHFYFIMLALLAAVGLIGFIGMGARRWINLYIFTIQPSEIMKIVIILALARYYSDIGTAMSIPSWNRLMKRCIVPLLIVFFPFLIVLKQPDLGSAVIIACIGLFTVIIAEKRPVRIFLSLISATVIALPFIWSIMHEYQKNRVITFFNPEKHPFGSGYHIVQSKIALGSGGFFGKGFLMGTQSKLSFLPEKHTDFIFATICEELGFLGGIVIILTYAFVIVCGLKIAKKSKSHFGMLSAGGIVIMFGLHAFINIGMVIGIIPVVGIPLQLVSYGGSSMLTFMTALGIVLCIGLNKRTHIKGSC
ncbi:MAG: rod shape-determining protein RodA [Holosporales bacterium]|jgi:rod shape determining protein RodA|nr:rod shape-determining protein RodA [Holosporales bacterium]